MKTRKRKKAVNILLCVLLALVLLCGIVYACFCGKGGSYYNQDGSYAHIEDTHSYNYAIHHPALDGFGQWILPWQDNFLATVTSPLRINYLMPMLVQTDIQSVLDGYNFVIDQANAGNGATFHTYYSEAEIAADSSKAHTGLMFLRGEEGAPFALVVPGGGWINVEANHEGFPVAKTLHEHGYNVFILRYRVSGNYTEEVNAMEGSAQDGIAALQWIEENAGELGVSMEGYSVWGFSAGGYIVNAAGNSPDVTAPAAIIMGYPALSDDFSAESPDTFIAMCRDDALIPFEGVENRVGELTELGVRVEFDVYESGGHGFGSGDGTLQEGWMEKAIAFWEDAQ